MPRKSWSENNFVLITGDPNIFLIGSSNAVGILKTDLVKSKVVDLTEGGMSVIINSKKSLLRIVPKPTPDKRIILVVGSNGFEINDYALFKEHYVNCLKELFHVGYHNHQVLVVLPLIRGGNTVSYDEQLKIMRELKAGFKFLKVATVCWIDLLSERLQNSLNVYGKRDMKLKRYIHYSEEVRMALSNFVEKLVREGFDKSRQDLLGKRN